MTTEEMLEALSKVPCANIDAYYDGIIHDDPERIEGSKCCSGTSRMFWRLVEKFRTPHPDGHYSSDFYYTEGWRLIRHDRLEALRASLFQDHSVSILETVFDWAKQVPYTLLLFPEKNRRPPVNGETDLAVHTAALYQYALNQGYITEEVG